MKKLTAALSVIALLALACGDDGEDIKQRGDPLVPTAPAYVLRDIQMSFNAGDIDLLKGMLSRDFVFYFDPADVGQNPPGGSQYIIPESWTYTEFWQAAGNMFELAYSIELTIAAGDAGAPGEGAETYTVENLPIYILVMVDELNGFIINPGYCDFAFEKYLNTNGEGRWRLTGWWDKGYGNFDGAAGAAPASLGTILALYR